jgi:putative transposase
MGNHVHLIAVPAREDSLSILFRRVHGRYAQYYNARSGRSGHLWQNRFFGCMLGQNHLWSALAYVERNPVRAGMVDHAAEYRWSSAAAHLGGPDVSGILDMEWWERKAPANWSEAIRNQDAEQESGLRSCTYSGRPFAEAPFVAAIAEKFGRYWNRGRPRNKKDSKPDKTDSQSVDLVSRQFPLF